MDCNTYNAEFDNVREFVEFVENHVKSGSHAATYENASFSAANFAEAIRAGKCGNPEYVNPMFEELQIIGGADNAAGAATVRDVTGQYFDVSDVINGVPECWVSEDFQPRKKTICITASIAVSCNVEQETITRRGAAIVALVDRLHECGYIVDLQVVFNVVLCRGRSRGARLNLAVNIPIAPLDIDALAFMLANPAALRRVVMAWEEVAVNRKSLTDAHYGAPVQPERRGDGINVLFLGGGAAPNSRFGSGKSARATIETVVEQINAGEMLITC